MRILEEVAARHEAGQSRRKALAEVAPRQSWSTYLHWWRCSRDREGAPWERQLDGRMPPPPSRVADDIVAAACLLRRLDPTITAESAQALLVAQFGAERGKVSGTVLKRVWKEAGLAQPRGGHRGGPREEVTALSGGGALALLAAAAMETGVVDALGQAVVGLAKEACAHQDDVEPAEADALRDDQGRFTGDYNRAIRGQGGRDPRRDTDAKKRTRRSLRSLRLLQTRPEVVGQKLLALGVSPLITERRGFDGLEGPSGAWLAALGGHAYADTTLDKCLAELALVDAGAALWPTHAQTWQRITAPWCEGEDEARWLQTALYIDATQDPYWTRQFASSGKVSRVGRVMPCLTRVAVMGGPGVPLVVDTHVGTVSLQKALLPTLQRMDEVLGEGELGRLTIVDAEMASVPLLSELAQRPGKWFITVLKGQAVKAAERSHVQPWQRYRQRDLIRAVEVHFDGKGTPEGGLTLRGVEKIREGSRNPTTTLFVTNATVEELTLEEVPDAYLSRWPHQEQRFRNGRNGLGLEHSHGYGGDTVAHVVLSTKLEQADRAVARAEARVERTKEVEAHAQQQLDATEQGARNKSRAVLASAAQGRRSAERALIKAQQEQQRLATMPREIYARDTTRDGIVTCAKLTVLMLLEFVLKEYFGNLRMEPRTFIELFVATPVTIRETRQERTYELQANPRSPANTQRLRDACAEVTRRQLRVGDKRLRFVVVGPEVGSSP
ncbi:MAG: transposase [Deltaproteobacteria bacterium]|nr:transposase [Deltaproteobacteria bacterium]